MRFSCIVPSELKNWPMLARALHTKTPPLYQAVPPLYQAAAEALDPKVPTHDVLTRLRYVTSPKPGLVHWMPMGMLVLNKTKQLVARQMQRAGAHEVSLSPLSHLELWQKTGRWGGSELFKLKDSGGSEYCLAPTGEEEITTLVKQQVASYKSLPLLYYQIGTKFRDEKRPRGGLLRGREFVMKDAYSFDVDEPAAMAAYHSMVQAYRAVLGALKVPFVQADADLGDIGGPLSHEWHYVHPSGEDTLFVCDGCGHTLNVEKTLSYPVEEQLHSDVAVRYYTTHDRTTLVCAYYPALRVIRPSFLADTIADLDLSGALAEADVLALFQDRESLLDKRVVRVMDSRLDLRLNFPDFPVPFANRSLVTTLTDVPIVEAHAGELCSHCSDGTLHAERAIEVGHTFYLGDKYTKALQCTVEVPQADGSVAAQNVLMGCYGIGISRIIAAAADINRDRAGLRWPAAIAPWQVTVVAAAEGSAAAEVAHALEAAGIDARVDDRAKIGLGRKIRDSNATGIPLVAIVGKQYPQVELEVRGLRRSRLWEAEHSRQAFAWDVDASGAAEKHVVGHENVPRVAAALLADM